MRIVILYIILSIYPLKFLCQSPSLIYGPYLQQASQSSIIVCWRSNISCDSKVNFGLTKFNLNQSITNGNAVVQHSVSISGLNSSTKYFYTISNTGNNILTDTFYFYTAPAMNAPGKVRFIATGDCGTGQTTQINIKNALNHFNKNKYVNGWLLLGDNAYYNGTDAEYSSLFFAPYQNNFIMQNTCLYPCIGNHDYANDLVLCENKLTPYYDIFNLPTSGQLGGLASGTEAYYSYNYGNIHFISLDSYGTELSLKMYDTLSTQYTWLKQDLMLNNSMWTIIYFHHPPYTMGSHNSDYETDLVKIRTYLTPLFERNNVDMVLNGHSHNLERSWMIKGHTGNEGSFNKNIHCKDSSTARYDGSNNSCAYIKDSIGNKGVIYTVCGSSGWVTTTQGTYPHDAMCYSNSLQGMGACIETDGNRLNAYFIGEDSLVHDQFTIFKNIKKNRTVYGLPGQIINLNASWNGNYVWSNNSPNTKQQLYTVNTNTVLYVRDSLNCFADTFHISIGTGFNELNKNPEFRIYPNPVHDLEFKIDCENVKKINSVIMIDVLGNEITLKEFRIQNHEMTLKMPESKNGEYIIRINTDTGTLNRKIILRND